MAKNMLIDEHCEYKGILAEQNGIIYTCTLNQTDIKTNKNKFYIMQLIHTGNDYVHFIRYGRIGETGVTLYSKYGSIGSGINAFTKQFKTKTGNNWENKENFVKKKGKYFLADISYDDELKDIKIDAPEKKIPDSKLDIKVQNLLRMLGDINMMNNALISLNIDTKKMPLGKLSKTQLEAASNILNEISKLVSQKKKNIDEIMSLSSDYYTYIPYSCGRNIPPIIDDAKLISENKDKIEELKNIVVGAQIIKNTESSNKNPIDSIYDDIKTKINPLDQTNQIYQEILKWIKNTHGSTHNCKLEVLDIYEVEQEGIKQKYENCSKNLQNKTLLFHGTHQSCVLSIFKNNFYLDPTKLNANIQIAGKMFGYGVYWADAVSKSFNYTRAESTNDIGCLLVGEIALGNISEEKHANYNISKASLEKINCHSTKGLGEWAPSSSVEIDNIKIHNGELKRNKKYSLLYNEYIVYDIDQILTKYIVIVKNTK